MITLVQEDAFVVVRPPDWSVTLTGVVEVKLEMTDAEVTRGADAAVVAN